MSSSSQRHDAGRDLASAWQAPALSTLPIRATSSSPSFHNDGWKDGAILTVTASLDAPAKPGASQPRASSARCNTSGAWEAPAVTTLAVAGR